MGKLNKWMKMAQLLGGRSHCFRFVGRRSLRPTHGWNASQSSCHFIFQQHPVLGRMCIPNLWMRKQRLTELHQVAPSPMIREGWI